MKGRVLIIAGSDSSGGAGIQADIKTVTALGGYAMTGITAITVQSTERVFEVVQTPADVLARQVEVVLEDIGADVIKIGMLGDVATAKQVTRILQEYSHVPVVLDPVLVATSGDKLATGELASFIKHDLLPITDVLTPNLPEASVLSGTEVNDWKGKNRAASTLLDAGANAVLLKGGHGDGEVVEDVLYTHDHRQVFSTQRLDARNTHGTGCTLASAIATRLAQGKSLGDAVVEGIEYTQNAIRTAPDFGKGHGPLNHSHTLPKIT